MSRTARRVLPLIASAALVTALALPGHVAAAGIGQAYRDYAADGKIDPCKYSVAELQSLLSSVPIDVAQYDPRFVDELNRALDARASGACKKKKRKRDGGDFVAADGGSGGASGGGGGKGDGGTAADGSPAPAAASAPLTTATPASRVDPDSGSGDGAFSLSPFGLPLPLAGLAIGLGLALFGTTVVAARRYGWSTGTLIQGVRQAFGR